MLSNTNVDAEIRIGKKGWICLTKLDICYCQTVRLTSLPR